MSSRKIILIISAVLLLSLALSAMIYMIIKKVHTPDLPAEPVGPVVPASAGAAEGNGSGPAPEAPELTWLKGLVIPPYSGEAYVTERKCSFF